jgi:hypothetical protein
MSYIKEIGGQEMVIGEVDYHTHDYEVRASVLAKEIIGLNHMHKQKTSEEYLTKLAVGLIYRLVKADKTHLIQQILDALFDAEYSQAGYTAKLYKYYLLAMVEKGYDVIDPYKDTDAKYYHT